MGRPRKNKLIDRPGLDDTGKGLPKRPLAPRNVQVTSFDTVSERARLAEANRVEGMHMFYGDRDKMRQYLAEGYVQVVNGGEAVHHRGDPLLMIPDARFADRRRRDELESVAILQEARSGKSIKPETDSDGVAHSVKVEQQIE